MEKKLLASRDLQQAKVTVALGLGAHPQNSSDNALTKVKAFWNHVLDCVKARVESEEKMLE